MNLRRVILHEGPMDGCEAFVSHTAALVSHHLYVWDGGSDPDRFVHAKALVARMTPEQLEQKAQVDAWLPTIGQGANIQSVPKVDDWVLNLCCYLYNFSVRL